MQGDEFGERGHGEIGFGFGRERCIGTLFAMTPICSGAQSKCGGRAIKGGFRRRLTETGAAV